MRVVMNYGKSGLPVDLPERWTVDIIRKRPMPPLPDPQSALEFALDRPTSSRSLKEEARGCRSACIVICDITRPVPNGLLLRPVIERLVSAGIPLGRITILIATGLHRPNEGDEMREVVGDDWVLDNVRVVNHFARRDEEHVRVGVTSRGTPVWIDRRFVEADLRIVTGLVEPHFMAGYSGGRKLIAPGIAHAETITAIHSARFLEDLRAADCVLEGNPLHEEQIEIARMSGRSLAVNTVIDECRRLSLVNFGDIEQSHAEAVGFLRRYSVVEAEHRYRTVLTSAAGYPLDKTYYQTVKGMVSAARILEPGGNLFVVSECSEGMGSPEFVEAQERLAGDGIEAFIESIRGRQYAQVDEWETEMLVRALRVGKVHLYSGGLAGSDWQLTCVNRVTSLENSLAAAVEAAGDGCVAVIPEGPYVAFSPDTADSD